MRLAELIYSSIGQERCSRVEHERGPVGACSFYTYYFVTVNMYMLTQFKRVAHSWCPEELFPDIGHYLTNSFAARPPWIMKQEASHSFSAQKKRGIQRLVGHEEKERRKALFHTPIDTSSASLESCNLFPGFLCLLLADFWGFKVAPPHADSRADLTDA